MTLPDKSTSLIAQIKHKKILLVIDVQENLLRSQSKIHIDPGTVAPFLASLNKSIKAFEEHGLPVIYTINEWTNPLLNLLTGNVCKKGTKGTGIDNTVSIINNNIFYKSSNNALKNKNLLGFLKKESIYEIYLSGLFAEYCVKSTLKAAINKHYRVIVIEEAVGSKNEKLKSKSIDYFRKKGASILSIDQLVGDLPISKVFSK